MHEMTHGIRVSVRVRGVSRTQPVMMLRVRRTYHVTGECMILRTLETYQVMCVWGH